MQRISTPGLSYHGAASPLKMSVSTISSKSKELSISISCSAWTTEGTQNNLLIERKDNIINMCELMFYNSTFTVNKDYYETLKESEVILSGSIPERTAIHTMLITTFGLEYNSYSSIFSRTITMEELFKDSEE